MEGGSLKRLEKAAPLRQQVYEVLEEQIIFGVLKSGHHLVESRLARQLGVSRIPVREALQLLHRDGWVDLRPRQGAFVHEPTMKEVDEVFRVRSVLEIESSREAAEKATEVALRDLRGILDKSVPALEAGDEKQLIILNSAFHARVAQMTENRVLTEMIGRLDKRIRWYFAPVVKSRGELSWKEHRELAQALAAHDPQWAADTMRKHAEETRLTYRLGREPTSADVQEALLSAAGRG